MASKREEERNEKIIRGLMKLPPNRRCINCNNLGPQYVCTNFWTFVCMICSGIHREFTHRVKSVSMSKFTSQEVEALQNGGNQRAREMFLKDWDLDRQRLPNSSNVDKVREFIKAVYVDRKFSEGNKSDKPPRDTQIECNSGDETRRASSYHSYSQSPPYDFQYEDRLKRKQGGPIARKPGSSLFERKTASFAFSPGRFSDHVYEDRFANEGSASRFSDYSISSGGDPFRSGPQSPNLQKDEGYSSTTIDYPKEIVEGVQSRTTSMNAEAYAKRDADRVPLPRPQRTVSSGSFGSFDSNPASHHSVDAGSFEASLELSHSAPTTQNQVPTFPPSSQITTKKYVELNLFEDLLEPSAHNSASGHDLFQAPSASALTADLFQASVDSSALPQNVHASQTSLSSASDYFGEISQKSSHSTSVSSSRQNLPETPEPSNEGWATFDLHQPNASTTNVQGGTVFGARSEAETSFTHSNPVLSATSETERQWADFQTSVFHGPALSVSIPWNEQVHNIHSAVNQPDNQPWKAFENDNNQHQFVDVQQGTDTHVSRGSTSAIDQYLGHKTLEGIGVDGFQNIAYGDGSSFPSFPFTGQVELNRKKPGNPFDIDSEIEVSNAFLDMSSLQVSLPSLPLHSSYVGSVSDSWFPSSPIASQGGVQYMAAQPSNPQIPNVPAHGPVASIGGNPFA